MEVIVRNAVLEVTIQSDRPFTVHIEPTGSDPDPDASANIVQFPHSSSESDDYEPNPR